MVQQSQCLSLCLEAGEYLFGIHTRFDDIQCHQPLSIFPFPCLPHPLKNPTQRATYFLSRAGYFDYDLLMDFPYLILYYTIGYTICQGEDL